MSGENDRQSLDELSEKLRAAKSRQDQAQQPSGNSSAAATGMAIGFRIAVEIMAALAIGFGIGYFLDQWLGTKPWLMILFFFLGIGGAFMNVMRVARQLENKKEFAKGNSPADSSEK
ncbi:AtpZ/AtpI family protein [Kiloniella sp. b19]|uniref:AtpZ/AtpI family protein n=1 Tax=Kiloniella sp. GXU_MW_B19 TaxID=3141326 RepID=UPI0031DC00A8